MNPYHIVVKGTVVEPGGARDRIVGLFTVHILHLCSGHTVRWEMRGRLADASGRLQRGNTAMEILLRLPPPPAH